MSLGPECLARIDRSGLERVIQIENINFGVMKKKSARMDKDRDYNWLCRQVTLDKI